jgi:hypothetical protein
VIKQTCPMSSPEYAWRLGTKGYFGGCGSGNIALWEYDATLNNWTARASYPGSPVFSISSFAVGHRGYVGIESPSSGSHPYWFYEQVTNTWGYSGFNGNNIVTNSTAFVIGTNIHVGTGWIGITPNTYYSTFATYNGTIYDCQGVLEGPALPGASCNDNNSNSTNDTWNASCVCVGTPAVVRISVKALLEGAAVVGSSNMQDQLRSSGLVPINEPYTALGYSFVNGGGESTTVPVLTATGSNAIVDWVILELRSAGSPGLRVSSRAALIQRDGDVVDVDGLSPVSMLATSGNYYVVIRHRNHLGCMSANPLALTSTVTSIDFTLPATSPYGTNARKTSADVMLLWVGDVTFNGVLGYVGSGNDRDPILVAVVSTTPNGSIIGYRREDTNMDGVVLYTGSGNDRDIILQNVGSTTPNAVRLQQVP